MVIHSTKTDSDFWIQQRVQTSQMLDLHPSSRRGRDSNPWYRYPVRQFSKLVVSATHPPLRALLTDCGGISLQPGYKAKLFLDKSKKMKLKYETRTNLFVVVNSLNNICKDVGNRKNCKFRQIFVLFQRNGVRNDHLLQCTLVDAVVCRA